jgi:hypothetical protein
MAFRFEQLERSQWGVSINFEENKNYHPKSIMPWSIFS